MIAIAGQSNATGVADVANVTIVTGYSSTYSNVTLKQQQAGTNGDPISWSFFATTGLKPRAAVPNMGCELSLGRYLDRIETVGFSLSKFGIPGSGLADNWLPTSTYPTSPAGGPNLFTQWMSYISDSLVELNGTLAAIVWIQGENDAGDATKSAAYESNLTALITTIRTRYSVPFIFNQLSSQGTETYNATVRTAQANVAANMSGVTMVNVDDLALETDHLHFTADSYVTLGNRFGKAVAAALGVDIPPSASFTVGTATGLSVPFTDTSTDDDGTISARLWDFGDSTTSTATNPTHVYGLAGTYTVSLTVTDDKARTNATSSIVNLTSWTTDATSGKAIPQTGAEWDAFIAQCVTNGMTNPGRPDIWLKCQEASGNLVDSGASALTFTASGTGLGYRGTVTGWTSKAVATSDNGTGTFRCTDATLPDMSSGAMSFFSWSKVSATTGLARALLTMGTTTLDYIGGQTTTRVVSGANSASGNSDTGVVRPYGLVGSIATSHVEGYTDASKATPTSSGLVTGKGVGIGAVSGVVSAIGASTLFAFGWKKVLAAADIKIMLQTAGWTVTWT